jgi:hypothetical protein
MSKNASYKKTVKLSRPVAHTACTRCVALSLRGAHAARTRQPTTAAHPALPTWPAQRPARGLATAPTRQRFLAIGSIRRSTTAFGRYKNETEPVKTLTLAIFPPTPFSFLYPAAGEERPAPPAGDGERTTTGSPTSPATLRAPFFPLCIRRRRGGFTSRPCARPWRLASLCR